MSCHDNKIVAAWFKTPLPTGVSVCIELLQIPVRTSTVAAVVGRSTCVTLVRVPGMGIVLFFQQKMSTTMNKLRR